MASYVEKGRKWPDGPLTMKELEDELERLGREMLRQYRRYNPDAEYLSISLMDGMMEAHNRHWGEDAVLPLQMKGRYVG